MKAVILAGGLGTRLKPFTEVIPKPLLPVGESSVLEIQILSLVNSGVTEIFIATNYMSEYVQAFLGDGSKYGIKLSFSKEEKPLGTCGPITLLQEQLTEPFLLMNGDVLTKLDFRTAYNAATEIDADLVVITTEITTPFDFGNVICDGNYIVDVHEKPNLKMEILAGMYIMKPSIFDRIPKETYYGIDDLIKEMLSNKLKVGRYLMRDYWLDIGRIDDYQMAQDIYKEHFDHLKK
ncbi:NTP transferase domain-containing protein [bacterium]|nr:NTP transferase domain-containing protein [bacterium]